MWKDIQRKIFMAPNNKITNYYRDPRCAVCGFVVRGWAKRNCDNCGQIVCSRHRPPFVKFWQCPKCRERQNQFVNQQPESTNNIKTSNKIDEMMRRAESLYVSGHEQEADQVTTSILKKLYLPEC